MAVSLKLKVIGLASYRTAMRRAATRFNSVLHRQLSKAGEVVIGEAKKQFVGERTRALYKIEGGKRVRRRPPRPVTSPPTKLGRFESNYIKRITQDVRGSGRRLRTEIGPVGVPYARRHELGIRMPKRPVLAPAIEEAEEKVISILGRSFSIALR